MAKGFTSDKCSIYFIPLNDDERDEFIDLLADELILGELEELRQHLLEEVVLEDKMRWHLEKPQQCTTLEA